MIITLIVTTLITINCMKQYQQYTDMAPRYILIITLIVTILITINCMKQYQQYTDMALGYILIITLITTILIMINCMKQYQKYTDMALRYILIITLITTILTFRVLHRCVPPLTKHAGTSQPVLLLDDRTRFPGDSGSFGDKTFLYYHRTLPVSFVYSLLSSPRGTWSEI